MAYKSNRTCILTLKVTERSSLITMGFCDASFDMTKRIGSEAGSWGYGSLDTSLKAGYTVGSYLSFSKGLVFYTLNGAKLGDAFTGLTFDKDVYPAVSICSARGKKMSLCANFGQTPFQYDIAEYVKVMPRLGTLG